MLWQTKLINVDSKTHCKIGRVNEPQDRKQEFGDKKLTKQRKQFFF